MSELPEDDPRMIAGQSDLTALLETAMVGEPMSRESIHHLMGIIEGYRELFKRRYGYTFPKMVPIVLVRQQWIQVVRRDLEAKAIQIVMHNLITQFRDVTADEIAQAIRRAFPDYRPQLESANDATVDGQAVPRVVSRIL